MSTTGYATADFNLWPIAARMIILALLFTGACAGSTAGGMKICRIGMMFKQGIREVRRTIQPRKVQLVRFEGKAIEDDTLHQVAVFMFMYVLFIVLGGVLLSLEGRFDMQTNFTAALTCVSNVGPGLGEVGPAGGFAGYGPFAKLLSSFLMLAGRLEIFPMLALFTYDTWEECMEIARANLAVEGIGHSVVIHSTPLSISRRSPTWLMFRATRSIRWAARALAVQWTTALTPPQRWVVVPGAITQLAKTCGTPT
jgi:Trk-type K+ transport system membrane component